VPRRDIVDDPSMPLFNGVALESFPRPFKPMSAARQRAWRREKERWMAEQRALAAARKAEHDARLALRPASMQGRYRLPDDVRRFLDRLYDEPYLPWDQPHVARERVEELLRKVYVQGCTQGYIEGRVLGMERDRLVSKKRNQRKRQKRSLDDRDAAIAAEYVQLCRMMAVGQARERLAAKYECDPRTIYNVARKAGLVAPRSHSIRKA
jgi:hypothetical protein